MNRKRIILGGLMVTAGLLAAVVLFEVMDGLISKDLVAGMHFNKHEILFGILAEGIRGYIVMYIYTQMKGAGTSFRHILIYAILMSLMVGAVWVLLGKVYFGLDAVDEAIIIFLQGVLSGIGIWMVYRILPLKLTTHNTYIQAPKHG